MLEDGAALNASGPLESVSDVSFGDGTEAGEDQADDDGHERGRGVLSSDHSDEVNWVGEESVGSEAKNGSDDGVESR